MWFYYMRKLPTFGKYTTPIGGQTRLPCHIRFGNVLVTPIGNALRHKSICNILLKWKCPRNIIMQWTTILFSKLSLLNTPLLLVIRGQGFKSQRTACGHKSLNFCNWLLPKKLKLSDYLKLLVYYRFYICLYKAVRKYWLPKVRQVMLDHTFKILINIPYILYGTAILA